MEERLPGLMIWTSTYLARSRHFSAEDHGVYFMLLIQAWWQPGCRLPNDDAYLAKVALISAGRWPTFRKRVLEEFWTLDGDVWRNEDLEQQREYVSKSRAQRVGAGKASAEARARRRLGIPRDFDNGRSNNVATERERAAERDRDDGPTTETKTETEAKTATATPLPGESYSSPLLAADIASTSGNSLGAVLKGMSIRRHSVRAPDEGEGTRRPSDAKWRDETNRIAFAHQQMLPFIAAPTPEERWAIIDAAEDVDHHDHARAVTIMLAAAKAARDAGRRCGWASPEHRKRK